MLLLLGCFFSSLELVTRYKGQDKKAEQLFEVVRLQEHHPPTGRFAIVLVNEGHLSTYMLNRKCKETLMSSFSLL